MIRLARLHAKLLSQGRTITRLHGDKRRLYLRNAQLLLEKALLASEVRALRRALEASPEEAKRMCVAYHDRCEQLTRANHAKASPRPKARV